MKKEELTITIILVILENMESKLQVEVRVGVMIGYVNIIQFVIWLNCFTTKNCGATEDSAFICLERRPRWLAKQV